MMKKLVLLTCLLATANSFASTEIRSASGASCEQSDFQPWEVSAGGGQNYFKDNRHDYYDDDHYNSDTDETQFGIKVTYKFGGAKAIDCTSFGMKVEREQEAYTKQLEMKVKQLEDQLAKRQHINSTSVKFK